jgi:hypothetical protein
MVVQDTAHALLPRSADLLKTGVGFTALKAAVLLLAPSLIRQTTLACSKGIRHDSMERVSRSSKSASSTSAETLDLIASTVSTTRRLLFLRSNTPCLRGLHL